MAPGSSLCFYHQVPFFHLPVSPLPLSTAPACHIHRSPAPPQPLLATRPCQLCPATGRTSLLQASGLPLGWIFKTAPSVRDGVF